MNVKTDEKRALVVELRWTLVSVLVVGAAKTVDERVGRKPELEDEKGRRPTNLRRERDRDRRLEEREDSCLRGVGRGGRSLRSTAEGFEGRGGRCAGEEGEERWSEMLRKE